MSPVSRCSSSSFPPATRLSSRMTPAAAPATTAPEGQYLVKKGDTLYSIALEHGADYRELAQWNGLDDPTKIRVGQLLSEQFGVAVIEVQPLWPLA